MPAMFSHCPKCGHQLRPSPKDFLRVRKLAGLTQRQIALKLGVKASHVAYLENGRRNPSAELVKRWMLIEEKVLNGADIDRERQLAAARKSAQTRRAA